MSYLKKNWLSHFIFFEAMGLPAFIAFSMVFLSGCLTTPVQAQNYRSSASAGATSGTLTLTINKPTGTTTNDVMIAAIAVRPNTATITAPTGWTLIRRTDQTGSTSSSQATYWKVAGSSEPSSYAWTFSASIGSAGGISTFYNINTNKPIHVESGQANASALTQATPSITTTLANTMVVTSHSLASSATWTPPAGMTEAVDRASDVIGSAGTSIEINYVTQAAAGATGTKTATAANDADFGVGNIAALASANFWTGSISNAWATAGNWSTGVVPTSSTDVIIPSTATQPTISTSVNCNDLIINSGATLTTSSAGTLNVAGDITNNGTMTNSGTTNFNGSTAQTFSGVTTFNNLILNNSTGLTLGSAVTINGDLTIKLGTLTTNNNNITLAGNLTNNGGFTAGTGTVTFTGSASKTVTGTATTAFNTITVNKGTDYNSIIDVQSVITMASGGLTLTNGTLKISSASTVTVFTSDITTAPYRIPATAGLWVNGGTVSTTSDVTFAGLMHASAGTLNIGNVADGKIRAAAGASIIVDGGIVNLAGRLSYANVTDAITFNMSAGTLNAGTIGTTSTIASFNIINSASTFTMSGGTIVIVRGSTTRGGYLNAAGTSTVTGGTLQIGNLSTPATDSMQINSTPPIWNLTINSTNAPVAQLTTAFVVYNDVTISGGKLDANNLDLTVGGNWANSGTFNPGTASVTFNGTTTISGSTVTNTFNNLTVAASSTVTSSSGITGLVVNGALTTGTSATLDLGTATVLSGTLSAISNSGTIITSVPTTTSATPIPAGKTWGGTIDYANAGANQTVVGGTYNNLTVRPGNGKVATASGNLVVNATLTVTTAFGGFDLSTYTLSGTLTGIVNNGDIKTSNTSTTPIPSGKTWGGTIYYNAATGGQTVVSGIYNIFNNNNSSGTNTAAGDLTVNNQFKTTAGGTLDMGSSYRIINMGGAITNNGSVKTSVLTTTSATPFATGKTWGGTGTVEYAATTGAQTVMSGTYNNLKLSNTGGTNTINGNVTINGIITLSGGTVTTGAFIISLNSGASLSRNSGGHVVGSLQKYVATGSSNVTFEIGDASNYTPVTVAFASVSVAGSLTVNVTGAEHPNLAGSGIRTDKGVNRYWTITNSGISFSSATLTFNWLSGDVDAGATYSNFKVGKYSAAVWSIASVASAASTSIQATSITSFGDFTMGELCVVSSAFSYPATPYCSSAGSATPTITGSAGTFTSTAGLSVTSSTGVVNLAASTAGTYTVTNTSLGGCSSTATSTIVVTTQPSASLSYTGSPYCYNAGTVTPTFSSNASGTFSSSAGLSINSATGAVNTGTSTAGSYTATYTVAASGGCTISTTSSAIIITGAPSATISYSGSPFCNTGTATVTRAGTAGGNYSSTAGLSINSSTGDINLAASTVGTYTVTYSGSLCGSYSTTTSITIVAPGTWSGAISNNWSTAGNWSCSTVPTSSTNVIIPSGLSTYPTIGAGVTAPVNNLTLQSGASVTVAGTLQIGGSITNSGSINATAGLITMNGTSAQTIPASLFTSNTVYDLTINNTAGVTLAGTLNLTDILSITNGSLTTGGYLTLKSSATNNGRVSQITSAATTPISGNVTVERYIPGKRKYRLITSSVTTSASATLSLGQESLSIWGNWQNQGDNTTANVGTIITGGTSANGFDQQTANTSLYTYNPATLKFVAFSTANGKNTKYTPLTAGVPYYMFVYGDRTNSVTTSTPNNTVLKETGTLFTGSQTLTTGSSVALTNAVGAYSLIGNPYAAVIDWNHVQTTNLSTSHWAWDPNLSSTGGYATVTTNLLGAIISPLSALIKVSQYIQPGQAFFVKTTATSPQLTFRESDKVDAIANINSAVFRGAGANTQPLMAVNLLYTSGGNSILADGAVAAFDPSFSNMAGDEDGVKMLNASEGIAFSESGTLLSVNSRQMPGDNDTLFLNTAKLTKPQYTFEIFAQQLDNLTTQPYLEDTYLSTSTPLSITDTNRIAFNIIAGDAASSAIDRFRIVFKPMDLLPVKFTSIQAAKKDKNIQVEWNVASQNSVEKYEVQRSADGVSFNKVAEVNAVAGANTQAYNWVDVTPINGNNYYRIQAVQQDGKTYFTQTVLVKTDGLQISKLLVFPNPVHNQQIKFQINAIEKGQYTFLLHNTQGQKILTRFFDHNGGATNGVIQPDKALPSGIYYLEVIHEKESYHQTVIVE